MVNLDLGWAFENGVTLYLDLRNLTDERYVAEFGALTNASLVPTNVFFPGEGRSAFGGISLRF